MADLDLTPGPDHRAETSYQRPVRAWMTASHRRWLYVVLTALIPLLIVYGVLDNTTAPLWLALAGAALGTTTAAAHTPRGPGS